MTVPNGAVYDVGDFRVRLGDVRQTFPTARVRGTVVEIEWRGPSVVDSLAAASLDGYASVDPSADVYGAAGTEQDADSGVDVSFSAVEEADVEAEYAATTALIREFWGRIRVDGAREAILVPGVGKEVKERLQRYRSGKRKQAPAEAMRYESGFLAGVGGASVEEDPDPQAGTDVARQYMEVLRFNR